MTTTDQKFFRPRPSTILSAAALTIAVIAGTAAAPAPLAPATPGPAHPDTPAQVSDIKFPTTISHRGGADVYPEESMEGFTASARDGFLPEMDIQFLADGTPVLIHDDTADRTLNGISGKVRDLSLEEWNSATIKHPTGGAEAATVTLEEALDELGGEVVMVPEIKPGATSAEVDQVLDEFDERGLVDSLIVQSFDFEAAKTIAERGYTSLYLTGKTLPQESTKDIAEAGIEWVGPSVSLPKRDLRTLIKAGFHVAPYTVDTAKDGHRLPGGVDGYFTDDPWTN